MRKSGILEKLTKVEATDKPFISVYLNAESNENGRDNFDSFLEKQLSVHQDNFAEDTPERESFDSDVERIKEYADKIPASANGVAIFACAAENYFLKIEFDVPFETNKFFVENKPSIYPLARLIDQNPEFAVVLADSNMAKLFIMQRGKVLNNEEIENTTYSRSDEGGWSQKRFQKHIDEMRKQHAREVMEELKTVLREEDIRHFVLAGNKDVVVPLLLDEMDDFLNERLAGTVRMEIDASENEIMDAAETVIKEADTLKDKEKIDALNEENYDGGKGVTGVAKTLRALANGQVQELYLAAKFDEFDYDENKIKEVLKEYAPGEDGEMANVTHPRQIADDMIARALDSAERIRFIEDENLLKEAGGVGALLRYTMSANQNQ
jgi:peptide chain release factor subunit 1